MRLAICDDDRLFLARFRPQVEALGLARRIDCFSEPEGLLCALEEGAGYDAVLMDIDWKGARTGMDLAEVLHEHAPRAKIIYVTGYNDRFSQQIFLRKSNLSGYLVKPVDSALLRANLEKAARAVREEELAVLTVMVGGKPVCVPHREIVYLESLGHTVNIHTRGEVVVVYERLDKLALLLSEGFLRCHKSFLVNMRRIRRFREQDILLDGGMAVPVSRSRSAQAKADYFRYMGKTL